MRQQQQWITTDIDSLENYPDGINQIYQGKIDGFWIKQVFSSTEMEQVKEKFLQKQSSFDHISSTQKYGKLYGAILTANGSDTTEYFKDAVLVREALQEIFDRDYEETIKNVFLKVSGNRKVSVANYQEKLFSPAQLRLTYPDTGGIALHKGNEFVGIPGFEDLDKVVKIKDCLSYYMVISRPEIGGEIILYDGLPDELTQPKNELDLKNCVQRSYDPEPGDLILFHGASIWHAVPEVKGSKIRYSIGGFLGLSQDDQSIYYWA